MEAGAKLKRRCLSNGSGARVQQMPMTLSAFQTGAMKILILNSSIKNVVNLWNLGTVPH